MKYSAIFAATILGASARVLIARTDDSALAGNNLPCGATHYVTYTVQKDDGVTKIRDYYRNKFHYNVGTCDIGKANGLTDINLIHPNQQLIIPTDCTVVDDTSCFPPAPAPAATETEARGPPEIYTVQPQDTMTLIAANFNITLASLEYANRIKHPNPDSISPGDPLFIPVAGGSSCIVIDYTIKAGDLFFQLAIDAHTTVGQIEASNPTADKNNLPVGLHIRLPTKCKFQNEPEPQGCKFCN